MTHSNQNQFGTRSLNELNIVKNSIAKVLFLGYGKNQTKIIDALISENCSVWHSEEKIQTAKGFDLVISFGYRHILNKEVIHSSSAPIVNLNIAYLPYNRGVHPNFWSFYDGTPSGVSIHLIDEGIDTGPILHQCRAELYKSDNVHMVGNRLIKNLVKILEKIINNFEKITAVKQWKYKYEKVFKEKDFNDNSLNKLFSNYNKGIVVKYLKQKKNIDKKFPVIENNIL